MAWWQSKAPGRYTIGWRETRGQGGTKRYKTFRKFEVARQFKTDIESRLDRGEYSSLEDRRVALGRYIDVVLGSGDLSRSTLGVYAYRRTHLGGLEDRPLGDIKTSEIRKVLGDMEDAGVGAPTRASVLKLLKKVFNQAVRDGILMRSPAAPIANPRSERREIRVFTPQEIMALADAIDFRYKAAVLVSAYGGLRAGEVSGLLVQDVDFLRATVRVTQAVALVRGRAVIGPPKTKASRRTVTLPSFVMERLAKHRAWMKEGDLIFTTPHGGLCSAKVLGAAFQAACKEVGIEGSRWHDLRHTSVALAIQAGAHPKQIQARLGHTNITQTLDVYGHLFPGMDEQLAQQMEHYGSVASGEVVPFGDAPHTESAGGEAGTGQSSG